MKIVHVESGMHLYGGALQVVLLLRGLQQRGEHNILVCPPAAVVGNEAEALGIRVERLPLRGDADLAFIPRLVRLLRRERPDVLHLHSRRGADVLGAIAGRVTGVAVVLSRRVDNPEPRWLATMKYRLYDRVITISAGIRQVLLSEGVPANKVVCVPSAVDTQRYHPLCEDRAWFRNEFDLRADEHTVAMIAQFIPRKGHRLLVEAAASVLRAFPRTRFLLFGRGGEERAIKALLEERTLSSHFVFAGFRNDLSRILPCLDVVVHPAYMEGLGVSLLQASACGVPVVAARAGGIPEVVRDGETGLLTQPADAAALASALCVVLGDELRARSLGEAGRQLVDRQFSVPAMVTGNHDVYTSVLKT